MTTVETTKAFKSERSAKIAVTKLDKAYDAALMAFNCRTDPDDYDALSSAKDAAWDALTQAVDSAKAQGFYVRSSWISFYNWRSACPFD
jgi:hypothetical protein